MGKELRYASKVKPAVQESQPVAPESPSFRDVAGEVWIRPHVRANRDRASWSRGDHYTDAGGASGVDDESTGRVAKWVHRRSTAKGLPCPDHTRDA